MSARFCTVRITAVHWYGKWPDQFLELSGSPAHSRQDRGHPIGRICSRKLQDLVEIAQLGTGYVTVGIEGRDETGNGPLIVSVQEVEAQP